MIEIGFDAWYAPPPTIVSLQTPIWPEFGTSTGETRQDRERLWSFSLRTEADLLVRLADVAAHQPGTRSKLDPQHIVEVVGDH
jgi:hypothetical protein